jgi:hypothetical protein
MDIRRLPVFELVCHVAMWLLRPLAVPIETLLHRCVGERACGLAGVVGLVLMELFSLMAQDSTMLHLLMFVFVLRVIVVIALSVLARWRGEPWSSRAIGTPWLCTLFPGLPNTAARWAEPFAALVLAMLVKAINTAAGDYLELSSVAMLAMNALRFAVTYSRYLDAVDEQIAVRSVPALVGNADPNQPNLPWSEGFPVTAIPVAEAATECLSVA